MLASDLLKLPIIEMAGTTLRLVPLGPRKIGVRRFQGETDCAGPGLRSLAAYEMLNVFKARELAAENTETPETLKHRSSNTDSLARSARLAVVRPH